MLIHKYRSLIHEYPSHKFLYYDKYILVLNANEMSLKIKHEKFHPLEIHLIIINTSVEVIRINFVTFINIHKPMIV